MTDKATDVTEHEAHPEKSYVRNCYIEGRDGEDVPLFTKGWVAHLDGYAIIPKEKYEALLNEQGHARTASEQPASGALKVLREALMSFVKSLDDWGDEGGGGNFDIFEHPTEINITLDHLRDAKKALSTTSEAPAQSGEGRSNGAEEIAQRLQDHMEQYHGVCLKASEWDAAIGALALEAHLRVLADLSAPQGEVERLREALQRFVIAADMAKDANERTQSAPHSPRDFVRMEDFDAARAALSSIMEQSDGR